MKEFPMYSKEIIKHFRHPKNQGKIKNPDGTGEAGNIVCGDVMKLYLKVGKNKKGKEIIKDVKFETFGCIVAIANTSILTARIKGKTLEEALKFTKEDLIGDLGKPLPPIKIHCSVLALDALHEAIYDYYSRNKIPIPEKLKKEHERIQKTIKSIEDRHKEFIEMEENILKR